MELQVQKYLRTPGNSLDTLAKQFAIKVNKDASEPLVILNYSQIDSPKLDPIVCECRGLVLEVDTWNIVSMAFMRFFNYGEVPDEQPFDFNNSIIYEKVDGSLIQLFFYNGQWMIATRGTIEGTGNVGFCNMSFRQLFDTTVKQYPNFYNKLDKDTIYIFELVSPENKVVRYYPKRELYLIGMRHKNIGFREVGYPVTLAFEAKKLGVNIPKVYNATDVNTLKKMANELSNLDEGFVCCDCYNPLVDNFRRVKVKSQKYLAAAHLKDTMGSSIRSLVQLVMKGDEKEFLLYFPEYANYIKQVKDKYDAYKNEADNLIAKAITNKVMARKDFANWTKTSSNKNLISIAFLVYDGKVNSYDNYLNLLLNSKGDKHTAKLLMNNMGIADMEFTTTT